MCDTEVTGYVTEVLWKALTMDNSITMFQGSSTTERTIFHPDEDAKSILEKSKAYRSENEVVFSKKPDPISAIVTR